MEGLFYSNGVSKADNIFHTDLLLFVFLPIIPKELKSSCRLGTMELIRKSAEATSGVPDIFFHIPSSVGFEKQGIYISRRDIDTAEDVLGVRSLRKY